MESEAYVHIWVLKWTAKARRPAASFTLLGLLLGALLSGCATNRHAVLAVTGTSIGVEIAQNPATQIPEARLGYQRMEVAIVPTNRSARDEAGEAPGGASNHANVLMELRYTGIFQGGPSSGIYQRLAVGTEAVRQPGAAALFLRDAEGKLDPAAAQALKSLLSIPETPAEVSELKAHIAVLQLCNPQRVAEEIGKMPGNPWEGTFNRFADGRPREPTLTEARQILDGLQDVVCP